MQPTSPQLPTDAPTAPAPKNLKKGALLLLVVIVVLAGVVAFLLPKKQVESSKVPAAMPHAQPRVQRAQADAYKSPTSR